MRTIVPGPHRPPGGVPVYLVMAIVMVVVVVAMVLVARHPAIDAMEVPGVAAPNVTVQDP